jgi:hypothetical protein
LLAYIATIVASSTLRVRRPRRSSGGRKSIVSGMRSREVLASSRRRVRVTLTWPLAISRLPARLHVSSR